MLFLFNSSYLHIFVRIYIPFKSSKCEGSKTIHRNKRAQTIKLCKGIIKTMENKTFAYTVHLAKREKHKILLQDGWEEEHKINRYELKKNKKNVWD